MLHHRPIGRPGKENGSVPFSPSTGVAAFTGIGGRLRPAEYAVRPQNILLRFPIYSIDIFIEAALRMHPALGVKNRLCF
jgi:hypothetical protein